ncbi:MAG: hypothetical protein HY998_07740 [candidate division NC10 bacterium]|nr:hypothetical protein [candidate division NC10 bacterium]
MRCVICKEEVRTNIDEHVDSHLSVSQNEILEYFKTLAAPFRVSLYKITCVNVKKGEILFSLENAKLFIGFAERCYQIPWEECCEWLALHEKAHIRLRGLYSPPNVNPNIISNVEDYYIEEYMMPREYRRVYEAHAKLIVEIRKMARLPIIMALRDIDARIYYYLTFATWYAYNVISLNDVNLGPHEVKFIERAAGIMRELKSPNELSTTISLINEHLACLISFLPPW